MNHTFTHISLFRLVLDRAEKKATNSCNGEIAVCIRKIFLFQLVEDEEVIKTRERWNETKANQINFDSIHIHALAQLGTTTK